MMKERKGIQIVKKGMLMAGAVLLMSGLQTTAVKADVEIDETNFPDQVFREWVSENVDVETKDGVLSDSELSIKEITFSTTGASSLQGIEFFTGLETLSCGNGLLSSLDVSKNTALKKLFCACSKLTSLDVSKNTALENLSCGMNGITSLDVSNNTALQVLECDSNKISTLDVSKNTALTELSCGYNMLSSLDVSHNTALTYLSCGGNQLSKLDVSKNTALTTLYCHENPLGSIDVSKNTVLREFQCMENQLTSLDVSKNTTLLSLNCHNNMLTDLDVSKNTELNYLYCQENQLTSLDVSKNITLYGLYCHNNQLSRLDVSKNTKLVTLDCEKNYFSSVDITGLSKLSEYHGTCEGNVLKVTAKEKPADQTEKDSYAVGTRILSKDLKGQDGNEAIPENSSFTITVVSTDGKTSGQAAFDGVEDENAAAVTIPKVIYISGVPYNVTTVSPKAFEKTAENAGYKVTDNRVDSLTVEYSGQVNAKKTKKTVNIPEYSNYRGIRFKVTSIAAKSFRKNTKVTKVKIASSITMIGANCFEGCSKLQQVTVGKGLTEIGKNAFKNCKKLTLIQLKGTKLKKVGKSALKGVNAKCKIKVPKAKVKAYTKLFKGKGQKKSVKVVKA